MEVINITSEIINWEQTGDEFEIDFKYGERPGFLIARNLKESRNCIISSDIHITTRNTTFLLDVEIVSHIEFKTEKTPTPEEIYELYKKANVKWVQNIKERSKEEGINPLIDMTQEFLPFPYLKKNIEKAIAQSLVQNN